MPFITLTAYKQLQKTQDALVSALKYMMEEQIDYMTINNLGNPEKQYSVKLARKALALAEGAYHDSIK